MSEQERPQVLCHMPNCGKDLTGTVLGWRAGQGPICKECNGKLERIKFELPLAIQELHAYALLVTAFGGAFDEKLRPNAQSACPVSFNAYPQVVQAIARVTELRKLESELKGE